MEGAKKLKSIKQIGGVAQAAQTLFPRHFHSRILLHDVSEWSIHHGERANCNGTKRGKNMNYGWLLLRAEGGNISITQANRREATNRVHSFLFPFQQSAGSKDAL